MLSRPKPAPNVTVAIFSPSTGCTLCGRPIMPRAQPKLCISSVLFRELLPLPVDLGRHHPTRRASPASPSPKPATFPASPKLQLPKKPGLPFQSKPDFPFGAFPGISGSTSGRCSLIPLPHTHIGMLRASSRQTCTLVVILWQEEIMGVPSEGL